MRMTKRVCAMCCCLLGLELPLSAHAGFLNSVDSFVAVDLGQVAAYRYASNNVSQLEGFTFTEYFFEKVHNNELGLTTGARWESGFGAQLSWQRLGDADVVSSSIGAFENQVFVTTAKSHSLALATSYTHTLTERLSLTGLVGVHRWQSSTYPSEYDPTWGATVDYRISERWSAGMGWRHFETNSGYVNRSSLQLAFHF